MTYPFVLLVEFKSRKHKGNKYTTASLCMEINNLKKSYHLWENHSWICTFTTI